MTTKYSYIEPLPTNEYTKVKIIHKVCGCEDYLCTVGMKRGVSCKKCKPKISKPKKCTTKNYKKNIPISHKYWGTVYYIKIEGSYKIGISERTCTGRFHHSSYEPIWEIPCKTKSEAIGIEQLILTIYNEDLCITHDPSFQLLEGGRTECFVKDVLGSKFDILKFINKIQKAMLRIG